MVARKAGAPLLEHLNQSPGCDVFLHHVFRDAGHAESRQCCSENLRTAVECQLSLDPHIQLTATLRELPSIETTIGRQPQIDAVVISQMELMGQGRIILAKLSHLLVESTK